MRSRLFGNKIKSTFLIALSLLLVLPTFLNLFLAPSASAVTCTDSSKKYCYVIKIYTGQGGKDVTETALATDLNSFTYDYVSTFNGTTRQFANLKFALKSSEQVVVFSRSATNVNVNYNVVPTKIEFYTSDGVTLLDTKTGFSPQATGSPQGFTVEGSTAPGGSTTDPGTQQPDIPQTEATCHSTSGAVGWIVCPILELASSASVWIYENVIDPSLRTRVSLFDVSGDNNGTYQAWGVFRNVANIVFIIILLFVIFSQVTGFGIDNYGIKKTLPKLIIAALLVNISFYICQLCIDLSNILGNSIYDFLNGIKIDIPAVAGAGDATYATSIIFAIFSVLAGGTAIAYFAGWSVIKGALLAVVPVLLGALIGILLLFFMLAMRQAIVVLLVVISPLAFVCYILPNTRNLFDRWSQLLRGMLLLYPICALMIAGGRMASKIILASGATENNLFIILVAMVAEAGPLFLIPGLTRSAYRATGQLGATLSGLRGRWTAGARNGLRNTQTYQNAVARNQRRQLTSGFNKRRIDAYNASAAKAPGSRTLRDRWNLRQGNRDRVASINERVLTAEEQQRKLDRMSNKAQVEGMRQQANISAQQQNVRNADYSNATFANAVITQNDVEHKASRERQMLYARPEYRTARENQNRAVISNEITKMYSDQFSRMNTGDLLRQFDAILKAPAGTQNHAEQFSAAFSALVSSGQLDKARETLHDNSASVNTLMQSDAEFRTKAMQQFGASGDVILQEYSKHIGTRSTPADIKDFATWANDTTGGKNSSLRASLSEKGLDRVDKDGFEFLSKNAMNAMAGASDANIAKVAASTTDAATVAKLADAISKLDAARRDSIMSATSGAQFVSMNENIRIALSGGGATGDAAWKSKVGAAIAADPQLKGRLNTDEQGRYI